MLNKSLLVFFLLVNTAFCQTLQKHVETLASMNGRVSGSVDGQKAAEYLKSTLESYGFQVEFQSYQYRGKTANNVITNVGNNNSIVVVGAHYDGQGPGKPSADDNASGCAVLLEIAKNIKKTPTWNNVVFILFANEEEGMIGSSYYVNHPLFPKNKPDIKAHKFMINLDMVGHLKPVNYSGAPIKVPPILEALTIKYPFARDITLKGEEDNSDNTSFANKGIPCVFLHTGLHSRYHKSTDTPDSLNYEGMAKIAAYTEDFVRVLATMTMPDYNLTKDLKTFKYAP